VNYPLSALLGMVYGLSEFGLALHRRSSSSTRRVDHGSLRILWLVILSACGLGVVVAAYAPKAQFSSWVAHDLAISLFAAGLAIRWYAIIYLGRFFTVDVAIAADHRLIDTGPYRYIRHPSYTGSLIAFLRLALSMGNPLSAMVLYVPTTLAFLWRIRIEEAALRSALGESYDQYSRRTKRLIPALY
jgi:protein-S-isoprenylcysteine O-methyltransferase